MEVKISPEYAKNNSGWEKAFQKREKFFIE